MGVPAENWWAMALLWLGSLFSTTHAYLGAGYGDGPKHETSETSETKSETKIIRNTAPYHKSPVAATAVLNDYNFCDFYKKHAKLCPTDL